MAPGIVAHTCNPSTQEVESRGSHVCSLARIYSKTLFQKNKKGI
jgi:hypothetical protein